MTIHVEGSPDSTRVFHMRPMLPTTDAVRIVAAATGRKLTFPSPIEVAEGNGLVLRATPLPDRCPPEMTDGLVIYYRWDADMRERGTRMFRGVAAALIERMRGEHVPADVSFLAARLAAPPLLLYRAGIEAALARQPWVTERFLRAWWAAM